MIKKFDHVYKNKKNRAQTLFENKVIDDFKSVYSILLDKYNTSDFNKLNENEQEAFAGELNTYWKEENGLSEKGERFLKHNIEVLSENSSFLQKEKYFAKKANTLIKETLRQSKLKWKLYDIIDEMYKETGSTNVSEVLSPSSISNITKELLSKNIGSFLKEINHELNESAKDKT